MRKPLLALLCLSICLSAVLFGPGEETVARAEVAPGQAECVMEVSSRRILSSRNADVRLPMASTTKILTALILLEDCGLDETVIVPEEAQRTPGSSVYLRTGEQYTVRDLLYGLMLRSGNDCAVTLAMYHSGSVEAFARTMADRAARMGADHSSFANPHGLPDDRHYTTAHDLALIACSAMENATFREIVSCPYYEPRGWSNKNKLLASYDGAIGIKTGYTEAAGRCYVGAAERNGMTLVAVLLNCSQTYERTTELFDEAFAAYRLIPLVDPSMPYERMAVRYAFSYPLTKEEASEVVIAAEIDEGEKKRGEIGGKLLIYLQNSLLFSQNLYII